MKSNKKHTAEHCEYCGDKLRRARVRVYRYRRRRHVLFPQVPALVCPGCGHRIFEATAVEAMEHQLTHPGPGERHAELVVLSL